MQWVRTTALVAGAGLLAGAADAQTKQQVTGPVATYWMSAQTQTGFGTERALWPHLAFTLAFSALFLFLARRRLARA